MSLDAMRAGTKERLSKAAGQRGAVAIEFAFVFPILLALIYAGIVYSYVFVLQQAMTFAADQGAQAAVSVSPGTANYNSVVQAQVKATISRTLSWLPPNQLATVINNLTVQSTPCPGSSAATGATTSPLTYVCLNYPMTGDSQIFPSLPILPGVAGSFPPLPAFLRAHGVVL